MQPSVLRRTLAISVLTVAALMACAAPAPAQTATPRVIGGGDVAITQYPFQVRLRIQDGLSTYLCGGSIVDASHVVTAAHCVTRDVAGTPPHPPLLASNVTVFYGSSSTSTQQSVNASALAVPTQYTLGTDESYDVAQITLQTPLTFSSKVQAIKFASPSQPKNVGNAFVTGFGLTSNGGSTSSTLKGVTVPLRADSACSGIFGSDYVPARAVCAGGGSAAANNPDTCNGDSGGPLVVDIDNSTTATNYVLLGLTSFGDQVCGKSNTPAVYTYLQGTGIRSFFGAGVGSDSTAYTSGNFEPVPRQTTPVSGGSSPAQTSTTSTHAPAAVDRTKPKARVVKVRCKHRRCAIRLRASDKGGGTVRKLSVRVRGKVRKCRAEGFGVTCRTVRTRTRKPRAKKVAGGYRVTVKLKPGSYSLTAVATDTSGNRSSTARKRFRVRR